MPVKSVSISNFRNISSLEFAPSPHLNVFTGSNAQGKTGIIEAVRLCLCARSHRARKNSELIGPNAETALVKMVFQGEQGEEDELMISLSETKRLTVNGQVQKNHLGLFRDYPNVFFSPEDLELVGGAPALRRGYINEAILSLSAGYAEALSNYNKALKQRNTLLKYYSPADKSLIEVYDEQLITFGSLIIKYRIKFLKQLEAQVFSLYKSIAGADEPLRLSYVSDIFEQGFNPDISLCYERSLKNAFERDIMQKSTTCGIHKDDIAISLCAMDAARFASRGQQRSIAVAMKLSQVELIKEKCDRTPIVFLDDVMSELDKTRRENLLGSLGSLQCFITTTECDFLEDRPGRVYTVSNGLLV